MGRGLNDLFLFFFSLYRKGLTMDEMKLKLSTKFMRNFISKIISKVILNKFGFKPDMILNEFNLEKIDDKIHLHINVDAEITDKDFLKITRLANLD